MIDSHLDPELLSAYLDDEVTAAERTDVEQHLKACEACRRELDSLRWTVSLLQELPAVDVPRPLYVREADLAPASDGPTWLERLTAFTGTFRMLSYASALSFVLVFMLTIAGVLPTGEQQGAAPAMQMERAPLATDVVEERAAEMEEAVTAAAEEAEEPEVGIAEEAPAEEPEADQDAPQPEVTDLPVEEDDGASIASAPEPEAEADTADESATTMQQPAPRPPPQPSLIDRLGIGGWLLLLTGVSTLAFGGLARWLRRT